MQNHEFCIPLISLKGPGHGPSCREGARETADEISSLEVLMEGGFGSESVSNAFSSS